MQARQTGDDAHHSQASKMSKSYSHTFNHYSLALVGPIYYGEPNGYLTEGVSIGNIEFYPEAVKWEGGNYCYS
jgi:hypothetical protein